jgi:HAD superfamily hydrolase (TIGR01662 family)
MGSLSRRAAFLDRDGTLNVRPGEHEYLTHVDQFVWLPGAPEALARLSRAGYVLAVVSNQRGVARGLVSLSACVRSSSESRTTWRASGAVSRSFGIAFMS